MLNPYDAVALWGDKQSEAFKCPCCGSELDVEDELYLCGGDVVGCTWCVDATPVYEYEERRDYGENTDAGAFLFPA